jgi:hypothetical protein
MYSCCIFFIVFTYFLLHKKYRNSVVSRSKYIHFSWRILMVMLTSNNTVIEDTPPTKFEATFCYIDAQIIQSQDTLRTMLTMRKFSKFPLPKRTPQ